MEPLPKDFYEQPTERVAQELLGKVVVRRIGSGKHFQELSAVIVEVEAYLFEGDEASHSFRGLKNKNASMFLPAGHLYVYPIHARHCMNIVTEKEGQGAAVLIRAAEPRTGLTSMWKFRNPSQTLPPEADYSQPKFLRNLGQGPGRLCESLAVDRALDGINVQDSSEFLVCESETTKLVDWSVCCGPRIGISTAKDLHLRWFIDGNHCVSGCAREHSAGRQWCFGTRE